MPRVTITAPERNAQPYRFPLDSGTVKLGRGSDNDITIESGSVSVHHAEMRRIKGGYELCDIGSTNGIKLNGERYETIPLQSGITAMIGDASFEFSLSEDEMRELAGETSVAPSPITFEPAIEQSGPPKKEIIYVPVKSGGSGSGGFLVFLILAAISFFVGLAIRHQKETGGSLIDALKAKYAAPQVAPALPK